MITSFTKSLKSNNKALHRKGEIITNNFIVSGAWGTASNWSLGRIPVTGENVCIYANCTSLGGNYTIGDLYIENGVTLTYGATARTLTVYGDLFAQGGTINMNSSASHILILCGSANKLGTLTNNSNSTVTYRNHASSKYYATTGRFIEVAGSLNYRNLILITDAGGGSNFTGFYTNGEIKVNNNLTINSRIRAVTNYGLEIVGTATISSSGASSESLTGTGLVTFNAISAPTNGFTINNDVVLKASFNQSGLVINSSNITIQNSLTITIGTANRTWNNVYINGVTLTKTNETGVLTITNLSGAGGASTLVTNSKVTITNNLGGVIVI